MPSLVASPPPLEETLVAAARQAVMELEGPGFNYSPLFDTEFRQSIVDLLSSAERAREAAAAGLVEVQKSDEKEEGGASWIQWLVGEQGQSSSNSAEAEELRRCIQHLSCSTAALAEVFSVSMPGGESSERQSGGLSEALEVEHLRDLRLRLAGCSRPMEGGFEIFSDLMAIGVF